MIRPLTLSLLFAAPAASEVPPDIVGLYAPPLMPADMCAVGHLQLSADGQLLGTGTAAGDGWLCAPGGEAWDCRRGEIVDGVLEIPRRDGTAPVTKMLPVPEEGALLWDVDGLLPKELAACGVITSALPGVGLPPTPPPARVDAVALADADGPIVGVGTAVAGVFPVEGIFGPLPEDDPSVALALKTLADPKAAETMRQMAESMMLAGCQTPLALTPGGRLVDVSFTGDGWTLRGVADCAPDGEAIACHRAAKRGGSFVADPSGDESRWRFDEGEDGWRLCREGAKGCAMLVACPDATTAPQVGGGKSLAETVAGL